MADAVFRVVHVDLWRPGGPFAALTSDAKVMFLYLMTGPVSSAMPGLITGLGIRGLGEGLADRDTPDGWEVARVTDAMAELQRSGLAVVDWHARIIVLPEVATRNPPQSPNHVRAIAKAYGRLPWHPLTAGYRRLIVDAIRDAKGEEAAAFAADAIPELVPETGHGEALARLRAALAEIEAPGLGDGSMDDVTRETSTEAASDESEGAVAEIGSDDTRPADVCKQVLAAYHETLGDRLPRVQKLTPARRQAILARVRDLGIDGVGALFREVRDSAFLCGDNDRGWRADFDWILKQRNAVRILEGAYKRTRSTHGRKAGPGHSTGRLDFAFDPEDQIRFGSHELWDAYLDTCVERFGWGGEKGPWPRFEAWIAERAHSDPRASPGVDGAEEEPGATTLLDNTGTVGYDNH